METLQLPREMLPTSFLSNRHFVQYGRLILASQLIKKLFSSGSSLPVVPAKTEESSLVTSVRFPLRGKRRGRRFAFGSGGSGPFSDPSANFNTDKQGLNVDSSYSVHLYSIYGNILVKEPQLLHRFIAGESMPNLSYPVDPSLTELFRSSARFWYESERIERRVPSLAAVQGPTRNATWEMSQSIATVGRSHLATIPFTLFYELFHQCTSNQAQAPQQNSNSAKKTGFSTAPQDFSSILSSSLVLSKNKPLNSKSGLAVAPARNDASSTTSRAVIQVVEYLFSCMEASPVDPSLEDDQCTLFLDGLEDFLTSRKGGDVVMRDLITWASLYETSGRKVIIGGRTLSLTENPQIGLEEEQSGEDDPSAMSSAPPSSSNNSPLQTLADLFLKGGQEAGPGQHNKQPAESTSSVNVRIEGGILRLALTAPAADRRLRLAFSQIQSRDRQSDILDANLTQLRSMAHGRWGVAVTLTGLPTRHALPSQQAHLREIFSSAGRGIMLKRRLNRDELNELLVFVLGTRKDQKTINEEVIAEALNHTFTLRHDPNRLSSDDLGHLLAERHINPATLSKYERRFVNCIATATTQTFFKDIAVPEQTVSALRALTSLPLSHPELFTHGVLKHSMTGVLLFGPPGTGKTMLARAVAQESGAAFLAVNMSNIFDMWVGEGEKNVKVGVHLKIFNSFLGNVYFGTKIGSLYHFY